MLTMKNTIVVLKAHSSVSTSCVNLTYDYSRNEPVSVAQSVG